MAAFLGALGALGKMAAPGAAKAVSGAMQKMKGKGGKVPATSPAGGKDAGDGGGKQKQQTPPPAQIAPPSIIGSRKKGGPIKKTGVYLLHKNEYVVPAKGGAVGKKSHHKKTIIKA